MIGQQRPSQDFGIKEQGCSDSYNLRQALSSLKLLPDRETKSSIVIQLYLQVEEMAGFEKHQTSYNVECCKQLPQKYGLHSSTTKECLVEILHIIFLGMPFHINNTLIFLCTVQVNIFRDFLTQNLNLFSTRASRHDSGIQSARAVMFTRMRKQIAKLKQTAGPVYKVSNFHRLASFCKAEISPTTCSKWLFNVLFDV